MRFLLRLPYAPLSILAFIVGIPFALAASTLLEAWFGFYTYLPHFMVLYWTFTAILTFYQYYARWNFDISEGLSTGGTVVAVIYAVIVDPNELGAFEGFNILYILFWGFVMTFGSGALLMTPYWIVEGVFQLQERPTFRQWFSFGRGGNARWAGNFSYRQFPQTGSIFLGSTLVSDTMIKRDVSLSKDDDAHLVTIAATGAGKSVTAIWPNLKDYKHPMIVLDPKGEHATFSAQERLNSMILDPYGKVQGAGSLSKTYNPLGEINIHSDGARALIQAIGNGCVFDEGKDQHFSESARTIIEGVIAHVLTRSPKDQHTLPHVADMFRGFDSELGIADPSAFDAVVADMSTNDAAGGLPMDAANLLLQAGDRERGSMLTTCFRSLKWVNDPPMRRHLSVSTYNDTIRNTIRGSDKRSLYIVLPFEYMEKTSQIRWMRVLINLVNVHLFQNPRTSDEGKVVLLLDEFFKLGYMPALEEGIVTARGAGMKYWLLLQDIGQLKQLYDKNWETFLGSSNIQVFGVNDQATIDWTAAALGGQKNTSSGDYPLMRPDEVRQFLGKESPTQIVIPATGLPMRLERLGFKAVKQFRGR